MNIPALNLTKQYATIKPAVLKRIHDVCAQQAFILGAPVAQFEKRIAHYCQVSYAIGCASGTDALLLSLMVLGIGKGDEVIVPSYTFLASVEPIVRLGAQPVFCDIDARTYNIDATLLEKKITSRTKAIIVVHLYGQTADMQPIKKIVRKYKVKIIEDACQAIGSVYGPTGISAGGLGDLACFSFFPSKNLGGFGDGGMIVTGTKKYAEKLTMLRQHGSKKRYYHDYLGLNSRLDALQAVVLDVKLDYLPQWIAERIKKAARYTALLHKALGDAVHVPFVEKGNTHTYHQYVIRITGIEGRKRDRLVSYLQQQGIGANVYYPVPCHLQKCFSFLKIKKGTLSMTEKAARSTLALPIFPELTDREQTYVVRTIKAFVSS